jgi:uncharacterized protein
MRVLVVYAAPGVEAQVDVELAPGTVVADAVAASGLFARFNLAPAAIEFAIYGQRARPDTPLADGDRVELTRPLVADPMTARRKRAADKPLSRAVPRSKRRR